MLKACSPWEPPSHGMARLSMQAHEHALPPLSSARIELFGSLLNTKGRVVYGVTSTLRRSSWSVRVRRTQLMPCTHAFIYVRKILRFFCHFVVLHFPENNMACPCLDDSGRSHALPPHPMACVSRICTIGCCPVSRLAWQFDSQSLPSIDRP